jgi:hypothetical protein
MAIVPGFQGKRFMVMYQLGVMHPIITGRTGKLPTFYNNLCLDYTLSRKWSIGIKYGFMTYKAPTARGTFYNTNSYYSSDEVYKHTSYPGRYMQHIISVQARKYIAHKGYIAPVGRYIILGAYYQYATDQMAMQEVDYNSIIGYKVQGYKTIAHMGGITVGMGRNYVVARRMLIDIGFCLNLTPYFILDGTRNIKSAAWQQLFFRNLFQINVGLGALAF